MEPIIGNTIEELGAALTVMEADLKNGQYAAVHLCTAIVPTAEDLELAGISMTLAGFHHSEPQVNIIDGIPTTSFVLKKGSPEWALLIPIIVPILTIGLITFGIFKIESITKALLPILLVAGGIVIVTVGLLARPAERVATRILEKRTAVPAQAYVASTIPNGKKKGTPAENPDRQLNALPQTELVDEVKELWRKACEWEEVPPDSKFVVFSEDNPHMPAYREAMLRLLRYKQVQSGEWKPATGEKERLVGRPFDQYQAAISGKFFITMVNPEQVKVTRSDRKGEFFVDVGPSAILPEGRYPSEPVGIEQAVQSQLHLTKEEAKRVASGIPEVISDDDPRADAIWDMWEDLEAESSPQTVPNEGGIELKIVCMYCKKVMGEKPAGPITAPPPYETASICRECWAIHMPGIPYPEEESMPSTIERVKKALGMHSYRWKLDFPKTGEKAEKEKVSGKPEDALYSALGYLEHGVSRKQLDKWDPARLTIWDNQTGERVLKIGTLDLTQQWTVGYFLGPRLGQLVYSTKTKLPPEWTFIAEEPEPILEVTPGMLPQTEKREGEKGWKDFYKGNRVQAVIDSTNWRIEARNVTEETQKGLHKSLKTDWSDLVHYQDLQAFGFASGLLTKEEAEQLYHIYGGESPSPEKWEKLTLAEKVAGTQFAEELLAQRLKRSGGMMPQAEGKEKQTLWDRAMYLLKKKNIRVMASPDEIKEIMSRCGACPAEVKAQMMSYLAIYPLFDAIAMWVQPVDIALGAYEPKVHQIAKDIIERYERQYSIKAEPQLKYYWVEKNLPYETWAIIEVWPGGVVRSPFTTKEEAIEREQAIWKGIYELKLVPSPQEKFPKQNEALKKLYPYEFIEYHDNGDLTIQKLIPKTGVKPPVSFHELVKGNKFVVTTEGCVFPHYTPEEALKKITEGEEEKHTKFLATIMEMAEWYAVNFRQMTLEDMRPIAAKHFGSVEEIDEFYRYISTPEGTKEFKVELREAMKRHGKGMPSEEEFSTMTKDILAATMQRNRILPFAGFKDDKLVWSGEFPDITLTVTVKDFVSTPKTLIEHAFKNSRAFLTNIITDKELLLSATAKGQIWWLGTIDNVPVEVHVTGVEIFTELELSDMFNSSAAVITEKPRILAATEETDIPAVIPTAPAPRPKKEGDLEYIADSPEYLAQTIDMTGWRQKIDQTFQEAVERVKNRS